MPYIKPEQRPTIDRPLSAVKIHGVGDLRHAVTSLCLRFLGTKGLRYETLALATGVLKNVGQELRRRLVSFLSLPERVSYIPCWSCKACDYLECQPEQKKAIDESLAEVTINDAGELNYAITSLCHRFVEREGLRPSTLDLVVDIVEDANTNLYYMVAAPYEDAKIAANGDILPDMAKAEMEKALQELTQRFSAALLDKLLAAERKYGWNGGWMDKNWSDDLRDEIRRHVEKGDPLDVAAYAAFAWHHNWTLAKG